MSFQVIPSLVFDRDSIPLKREFEPLNPDSSKNPIEAPVEEQQPTINRDENVVPRTQGRRRPLLPTRNVLTEENLEPEENLGQDEETENLQENLVPDEETENFDENFIPAVETENLEQNLIPDEQTENLEQNLIPVEQTENFEENLGSRNNNSGIIFNTNENVEISEFERIENILFNSTIHENEDGDDDNEVINENTDANENLEISEFEKIENILFNNSSNDDENDKTYEEEKSENGKRT